MLDLAGDAVGMMEDFGETVIYRPHDEMPRSIQAVVDRNPPSETPGVPVPTDSIFVTVLANGRTGIDPALVTLQVDEIDVPVRVGGAVVTLTLVSIKGQDEGLVTLEAR